MNLNISGIQTANVNQLNPTGAAFTDCGHISSIDARLLKELSYSLAQIRHASETVNQELKLLGEEAAKAVIAAAEDMLAPKKPVEQFPRLSGWLGVPDESL